MAGSVIDLLVRPEILAKARETFAGEVAGSTYRSLLPPDQKPSVDLNAEEMARLREQMRPSYLRDPVRVR
jgi:hypothetical protein